MPFPPQVGVVKPRKNAPCDVEIWAVVQLSAVPLYITLQDGNMVEVIADSWTLISDIEKQVSDESVESLLSLGGDRIFLALEHRDTQSSPVN